MDIPDALAEDAHPVLRKLEDHDIAGVEMDVQEFAPEAVDKLDHVLRGEQVTIEEDVLDVEIHL